MINTVEQDQGAVWSGSAVFITNLLYIKHCRTRSSSSVIRVCSVYNKVILLTLINTVEQDQVAVWSGSAVFISKSSYMINTVEQDQVAEWSWSAVFITRSKFITKFLYD